MRSRLNYFTQALNEAMRGIEKGAGAPFGACIVYQDQVIALSHDTVIQENDATCHAEINAIRVASKILGNYQLTSCQIYCTSEPCPMCLSAIHWAGIKECYFIVDRNCAAMYGFDDKVLYDELTKPINLRKMHILQKDELYNDVKTLFERWKELELPIC